MRDEPDYDIAIVGAGPAGLHAALKAAVLNHTALLVDKGRQFSRVVQAPALANIPGEPGIAGLDLLERGHSDLAAFERESGKRLVTRREDTEVVDAERLPRGGFRLRMRPTGGGPEAEATARVLVLATGLVDSKPGVERFWREGHHTLEPHIHRGGVGYCVLCEGWSVDHERVGVLGWSRDAASIARDLREHFDGEVTLLTDGVPVPGDALEGLREARVAVEERAVEGFHDAGDRVAVDLAGGGRRRFEKLFVALGWYKVNNELAVRLGAATTEQGYVRTNEDSEALDPDGEVIPGLYAIGDLRAGRWKQVPIAWGDAETAVISAYAERLPS